MTGTPATTPEDMAGYLHMQRRFGSQVICDRCCGTIDTVPDLCMAKSGERCPGGEMAIAHMKETVTNAKR